MKRLSIDLPDETHAALVKLSELERRSLTQEILTILEERVVGVAKCEVCGNFITGRSSTRNICISCFKKENGL